MALIELDTENTEEMSERIAKSISRQTGLNIDHLNANPLDTYLIQHPGAPWCFCEDPPKAVLEHRKNYSDKKLLPESVMDYLDEIVRRLWDDPEAMEKRAQSDYWKIYGGDPSRPVW